MDFFKNIAEYKVLGIFAYRYFIAFAIILGSIAARVIFKSYLSAKIRKFVEKTKFKYDDILAEALIPPFSLGVITAGFYYAAVYLYSGSGRAMPLFWSKVFTAAVLSIGLWSFYRLTEVAVAIIKRIFDKSDKILSKQFTPMVRTTLRTAVLIIGGIMIIQNLGFNVSSLLTGVGISGIAIALAAQDTIANVFGTFVMFSDKPFRVGDYIEFKSVSGIVEYIGFRSTKIRTFDKSLITVPNKLLTSEMIQNWSERPVRRIRCDIGLTYDAEPEQISALIDEIKDYLKDNEDFDQQTRVVNFTEFRDSSLNVFVNCFTATADYEKYLKIREKFNLDLIGMVKRHNLEFAFPSQSIYIENSGE